MPFNGPGFHGRGAGYLRHPGVVQPKEAPVRYLNLVLAGCLVMCLAVVAPPVDPPSIKVQSPTPQALNEQLEHEETQRQYDQAEESAARVLRTHCGDDQWAETIAHNAVDQKVPVRIIAAVVVIESTCRPGVVSSEGAVGLMQVSPRSWHVSTAALKDPELNVRKGTEILAAYTRAHGLREGLHRYNGLGEGCDTCDGQYTDKVLEVAYGR